MICIYVPIHTFQIPPHISWVIWVMKNIVILGVLKRTSSGFIWKSLARKNVNFQRIVPPNTGHEGHLLREV
jgi:hypothetical protein